MFGKSYLLDMYDCKDGVCDSLESHYRFLELLVAELGMTPMSLPFVIHAPSQFYKHGNALQRIERFPNKAGVSAWQPLIESGIQIHSIEPSHFSSLDVYTCGRLDIKTVRDLAFNVFSFKRFEENLFDRGISYKG